MSHKIIGFADSSNPIQVDYVKNQLDAIKLWNSELTVEFQNEDSELLDRYCKLPKRMPTYIIMKNNVYKTHIHAKLDNSKLFDWLVSKLG